MPRFESFDNTADILVAARKHRMFTAGDKVLVAVSGGPDSVALLHALRTHSSELGISLHVAHFNHGIRGEQSDIDEGFVRDLAQAFTLPITVGKADVPALQAELKVGTEEAARIARLEFLQRTAAEVGANKIALGHTADDRAESVLLNIIRGCGIDGLGSIRPVSGNTVRPLIETTRAQIEAYIAENALPYRVDETNADTTYTRNRVRHELLPLLEHEYNPEIRSALVRLAEIATSQGRLIYELAESAAVDCRSGEGLDVRKLLNLPGALLHQVIRSEIERVKGDLRDVTFEQVQGVVNALRAGSDFTITLPTGQIDAMRRGDAFRVQRRENVQGVEPFQLDMQVPGVTDIASVGLRIEAQLATQPTPTRLKANEALIDIDAVVGKLRVRNICPGDRITPLGMSGHKKLQDIFVDKKISRTQRARAAVIVDDEKILWVVGVVTSELGKVLPSSRAALHLTATRDL